MPPDVHLHYEWACFFSGSGWLVCIIRPHSTISCDTQLLWRTWEAHYTEFSPCSWIISTLTDSCAPVFQNPGSFRSLSEVEIDLGAFCMYSHSSLIPLLIPPQHSLHSGMAWLLSNLIWIASVANAKGICHYWSGFASPYTGGQCVALLCAATHCEDGNNEDGIRQQTQYVPVCIGFRAHCKCWFGLWNF